MISSQKNIRERTTLRITIVGLILALLGGVFLYISSLGQIIGSLPLRTLLANLGSLLLVTGTVTVAWELYGRRSFADEVRTLFAVSKSFSIAGVRQYATAFQSSEINWDDLFHRARHVDLLFMGSSSWRRTQFLQLEALMQREGSRLVVILPDPHDEVVISSAKARLGKSEADPKSYFGDACNYFKTLSKRFPSACVEIWFMPQLPSFSVFRFDDSAVVALYSHRRANIHLRQGRRPVQVCHIGDRQCGRSQWKNALRASALHEQA
jgi:hypothetical protein